MDGKRIRLAVAVILSAVPVLAAVPPAQTLNALEARPPADYAPGGQDRVLPLADAWPAGSGPAGSPGDGAGIQSGWHHAGGQGTDQSGHEPEPADLPVVGSIERLRELLTEAARTAEDVLFPQMGSVRIAVIDQNGTPVQAPTAAAAGFIAAKTGGSGHSRTNVQTAGVDEADLVKTDGTHLYLATGGRVVIIRAVPAGDMKVVADIPFESHFSPAELYAEPGRLVVIGLSWQTDGPVRPMEDGRIRPMDDGGTKPPPADGAPETAAETTAETPGNANAARKKAVVEFSRDITVMPPGGDAWPVRPAGTMQVKAFTKAFVYDTSDMASPRLVRVLDLEGRYLSSRKIGDSLYLVSNKSLDVFRMPENDAPPESALPLVRDVVIGPDGRRASEDGKGADGAGLSPVPPERIRYFPDFIEPNMLLIGAVNLASDDAMDVKAYLGSAEIVYASQDHLYTVVRRLEKADRPKDGGAGKDGEADAGTPPGPAEYVTDVYKFALLPGRTAYRAKGSVPGTVLNPFSMDEYDGHFRIATTTGVSWRANGRQWKNHLFVLNDKLEQVGRVTDIAPGERIYAVRFMGRRAYMVTFRTVDPLFAIDLSDPASPKVLGALKIPGYSGYLHPYDENHLIGFGKDAKETVWKDENGNVIGSDAYDLGMKVALFDVSDVQRPVEKHVEYIGDRGTHSELLENHKALLFAREKGGLLAFPVNLHEVPNAHQSGTPPRRPEEAVPAYGVFSFQGACVYTVDPERGFVPRGRITHLDEAGMPEAGSGDRFIRRILYIGDVLYTVSDAMVKASALEDLTEIGVLRMPKGN